MIAKKLALAVLFILSTTGINACENQDVVNGQEVTYLKDVVPYAFNGSLDSSIEHQNICKEKFGAIVNTEPLEINYNINVKTGIQSATVKLFDATATLLPMGIAKTYSFLTQRGIPEKMMEHKIRQIYFRLNEDFELKKLAVSFSDSSLDFQCIAESQY